MNKVEVGQRVRINDYGHFYLNKGDVVKVVDLDPNPNHFWIEAHEERNGWEKGSKICVALENVDFANPPLTKKQRIEALEKQVEELKLIVHELRKNKFHGQVAATEAQPPNMKRKVVIDKAKQFVNDIKRDHENTTFTRVKFVENLEKRTVVALICGEWTNHVHMKGVAKCMHDDVFNVHIGRAIALGRALKKDVSEFEQAAKPKEKAVGQLIKVETLGGNTVTAEIKPPNNLAYILAGSVALGSHYSNIGTIIDDSKAVY